jgi:hypothetical protein
MYCERNYQRKKLHSIGVNWLITLERRGGGDKSRMIIKKKTVALVRVRTIPTERPPPVGEVSANFCYEL